MLASCRCRRGGPDTGSQRVVTMSKKKKAVRRKKQAAASIGLSPAETQTSASGSDALAALVERDGGAVLGTYRDPFGAKTILIVSLPIDKVEPTPYQRDPS